MKQIFVFLTSLHSFINLVVFVTSIATSPLPKSFFYSANKFILEHQSCDSTAVNQKDINSQTIMYCDTYAPALMKLMIQYERGRINDRIKSLNGYLNYKISYLLKCASDRIDPLQSIVSLKCLSHSSIENQIRKSDSCKKNPARMSSAL